MWMGPHTSERDHSRVNGTTHFWTKPVDYQSTNGGPIHIWRSSHTRRYRLHVEDHEQPIPTYERDLYVWPGLPRVNGTCICERVLYLWRTLHPWTRHPRVNGTRCLLVNGFSTNVLKFHRWFLHVLTRHKENYTCRLKLNLFFFFLDWVRCA